jgi:hypothetical protein
MGEYAVVIAGIAVVCLVAALFVGSIVANRFRDAPSEPRTSLEPPRNVPQLVWPRSLDDCENGGWHNYVQFENERQCKDYVRDIAS